METKKWLLISFSFILLGIVSFVVVMSINHWKFSKFESKKYETKTYEITEYFDDINLDISTADVEILPSEDNTNKIVCFENIKEPNEVFVENKTLKINGSNSKWYNHIGISFKYPKISLYLSQNNFNSLIIDASTSDIKINSDFSFNNVKIEVSTGDIKSKFKQANEVKIKTTTGNVLIENLLANSLEIEVSSGNVDLSNITLNNDIFVKTSTGDATLKNITCSNFNSSGSTGNLYLYKFICKEKMNINRSTGDIKLEKSDANEIYIKTNTGNINATILSNKIIHAKTDTGKEKYPVLTTGGKCELITTTGDITVRIVNE